MHTKNVFKILSRATCCLKKLSMTGSFWLFLLQLVKVSNYNDVLNAGYSFCTAKTHACGRAICVKEHSHAHTQWNVVPSRASGIPLPHA